MCPPDHVISLAASVTGPSSLCIGVASLVTRTDDRQPGSGATSTPNSGDACGKNTWSLVVVALSRSFGVRNSNWTSVAPAVALSACTVTCADAGKAQTASSAADVTAIAP